MRKILACSLLMFPFFVAAQSTQAPAEPSGKATEVPEKKETTTDTFLAQFGIGLSVSAKLGRERSIEEAQLVNGIVRVTSERQVTPRLMLERHWYFDNDFSNKHFRQGLFVGLSLLGERKIMDSVSVGWLVAFKPNQGDKATHNLGLGLAVEPYSRVLGDGIQKNQPLPVGESSIRYKETNRTAIVLFYTYTMAR